MGAIGALSTTAGALRRNPVIVLGVLALSVIGSLSTVGQALGGTIVVVGAVIAGFLLTPFFTAGVLGTAAKGIDGQASLGTILREGAANYLTLLGATIIRGILFVVVSIVFTLIGIFGVIGGGIAAGGASGGGAFGLGLGLGVLGVVLLGVLAFLALIYLIQFYDVAVVMDDTGPWEAFKRSYVVVRRNLLSVLGYTLIAQAVNLIVLVPSFWFLFSGAGGFGPGNPAVSDGMAGGGMAGGAAGGAFGGTTIADLAPQLAVTLVLGTLVSSFLLTYRVAYYDDLTAERATRVENVESVEGQATD